MTKNETLFYAMGLCDSARYCVLQSVEHIKGTNDSEELTTQAVRIGADLRKLLDCINNARDF